MKRSTSFLYNESAIDEMGRSAQVAMRPSRHRGDPVGC